MSVVDDRVRGRQTHSVTSVPRSSSRPYARVHVVTVTYNSASTLDAYFAGLDASANFIAGVTVVDNASTDDTLAIARREAARRAMRIEVLANANTGFAGGYAAAAASSIGSDLPVLCLNPDVILADGAIEHMLDVLNSVADAGVVTMPLVEADGRPDTASRRSLPTLQGSMVYSVLGRFTPKAIRYNARETTTHAQFRSAAGTLVTELEATTGALMLVNPRFRALDAGIFDTDYWMYGEDLQLCADARRSHFRVLMAETSPSLHVKGVSSGRPRSRRANRAFHVAMLQYAQKNLVRQPVAVALLRAAIGAHFLLTECRALPIRIRRSRQARAER